MTLMRGGTTPDLRLPLSCTGRFRTARFGTGNRVGAGSRNGDAARSCSRCFRPVQSVVPPGRAAHAARAPSRVSCAHNRRRVPAGSAGTRCSLRSLGAFAGQDCPCVVVCPACCRRPNRAVGHRVERGAKGRPVTVPAAITVVQPTVDHAGPVDREGLRRDVATSGRGQHDLAMGRSGILATPVGVQPSGAVQRRGDHYRRASIDAHARHVNGRGPDHRPQWSGCRDRIPDSVGQALRHRAPGRAGQREVHLSHYGRRSLDKAAGWASPVAGG